jgi:hypothetical protein
MSTWRVAPTGYDRERPVDRSRWIVELERATIDEGEMTADPTSLERFDPIREMRPMARRRHQMAES